MTIAALGGAGYIGLHTAKCSLATGKDVIVLDNLITGYRRAVDKRVKFHQGDIRNFQLLSSVFSQEKVNEIVHFAASSVIPESIKNLLKYFDNNIRGVAASPEAMNQLEIKRIIFSPTAAAYGEPKQIPIKETDPQLPTNTYGESKLAMEKIMYWVDLADGLKFIALRYFNVTGVMPDGSISEDHNPETHLIPTILQVVVGKRPNLQTYGNDYPTKDGTNIRDYVHVSDLADAHALALKYLEAGNSSTAFSLRSAIGFSNMETLQATRKVTGEPVPAGIDPRRPGDPSTLIVSSDKAKEPLGQKPQFDNIGKIIETAWKWHENNPEGFGDRN